jgi:hypothetical protein
MSIVIFGGGGGVHDKKYWVLDVMIKFIGPLYKSTSEITI